MKKIKILLLSLIVLAILGGILAFKAKGTNKYCVKPIGIVNPPPNICQEGICNGALNASTTTTLADKDHAFCYTITFDLNNCPEGICGTFGFITGD